MTSTSTAQAHILVSTRLRLQNWLVVCVRVSTEIFPNKIFEVFCYCTAYCKVFQEEFYFKTLAGSYPQLWCRQCTHIWHIEDIFMQVHTRTQQSTPALSIGALTIGSLCWAGWYVRMNQCNTSLDPPTRGGGPDMRRCDSSGTANIIAGFSFDCLAGCMPQRTFPHY